MAGGVINGKWCFQNSTRPDVAIQWVAKLSGFRGCQVVSSLSCLMQIYGFYQDLQTTPFYSVAEARFPGGRWPCARGCLGIPAGDLIIRGVWKCSGMKKSRSLGNGKILIPNLSSACRRRFVRGWFGRFRRKAYLCLPIRFYYTIGWYVPGICRRYRFLRMILWEDINWTHCLLSFRDVPCSFLPAIGWRKNLYTKTMIWHWHACRPHGPVAVPLRTRKGRGAFLKKTG